MSLCARMQKVDSKFTTPTSVSLAQWLMSTGTVWRVLRIFVFGKRNSETFTTLLNLWSTNILCAPKRSGYDSPVWFYCYHMDSMVLVQNTQLAILSDSFKTSTHKLMTTNPLTTTWMPKTSISKLLSARRQQTISIYSDVKCGETLGNHLWLPHQRLDSSILKRIHKSKNSPSVLASNPRSLRDSVTPNQNTWLSAQVKSPSTLKPS
jgi:hypothetical protein